MGTPSLTASMAASLVSSRAANSLPPQERQLLVSQTDKAINVGYISKEMETLLARFSGVIAFFALAGLAIAVVEAWLVWSYDHEEDGPAINFLKVCISCFTVVSLVFLVLYYELLYKYQKVKGTLLLKDGFWSSGLGSEMVIELLLVAIHSPPYFWKEIAVENHAGDLAGTKVFYSLDSIISVFMWIRCYLLLRVMRYNSIFSMDVAHIFAHINSVDLSTFFAVKMMVRRRPMTAFIMLFSFFVVWFAFAIMIFERVGHPQFNNFFNDLWLTLVTMTTVGYGDMYPVSDWGRAFTSLAVIASFLLISLLVIGVSSNFEMNSLEEDTVSRIVKVDGDLAVMRAAVNLIGSFWVQCKRAGYGQNGDYTPAQLKKWKTDQGDSSNERAALFVMFWKRVHTDFAHAVRDFRETRRAYKKFDPTLVDHMLSDQCNLLAIDKELSDSTKQWVEDLGKIKEKMP